MIEPYETQERTRTSRLRLPSARSDRESRLVLRVFQAATFGGLLLLAGLLAAQEQTGDNWIALVYASWCVIAFASADCILNGFRFGVWVLLGWTGFVVLADMLSGVGGGVGVVLGVVVAYLMAVYLQPRLTRME